MAVNVKDEVIKVTIATVASILGGAFTALTTVAINKCAARDKKAIDIGKAKALIQTLEGVSDLSLKQSAKLERAMNLVMENDVEQIKQAVIAAIIISPCKDKDNAIVDIEHRLTVRGPVTRDTLPAQKKWLYDEVEGINRAYGINVHVTISI